MHTSIDTKVAVLWGRNRDHHQLMRKDRREQRDKKRRRGEKGQGMDGVNHEGRRLNESANVPHQFPYKTPTQEIEIKEGDFPSAWYPSVTAGSLPITTQKQKLKPTDGANMICVSVMRRPILMSHKLQHYCAARLYISLLAGSGNLSIAVSASGLLASVYTCSCISFSLHYSSLMCIVRQYPYATSCFLLTFNTEFPSKNTSVRQWSDVLLWSPTKMWRKDHAELPIFIISLFFKVKSSSSSLERHSRNFPAEW